MNLHFENQGTNTFLVYTIGENDELDTMSLGMLTNNKIPGFAPTIFTQVDNTKYIKYNVSSKVSVDQLFSGPVNKKRLLGVFTGIIDAMMSAEDYMLDTDAMLLDLEYIFADVTTCETVLICLPIMNSGHKNPELSMFFKNIIFNTQFDQTENCDHVAQILNYLNSVKTLSLPDFKELLKSMSKPKEEPKSVQPAPQPVAPAAPVHHVQPAAPQQPVVPQSAAPVAPVIPQMEIPVKKEIPVAVHEEKIPEASKETPDEKPMSMFYLLQHYNKENAAKYKAQQDAKKEAEKQEKLDKQAAKKEKKDKKGKKEAPAMAVPQQPGVGFAIPGQQPTVSASFEVPGAPKAVVEPKAAPQKAQPVIQKPQPVPVAPQVPVQTGKPLNFGETTVLGGGAIGETTVLGVAAMDTPKVNPYLIRAKNNEKIPLNKPVFRIGKERSYVDYFIGDNTAISRSHANIVSRDGAYFIVDTNSTNHTYVNGTMVHSNEETPISHDTRIRLANEEFTFYVY